MAASFDRVPNKQADCRAPIGRRFGRLHNKWASEVTPTVCGAVKTLDMETDNSFSYLGNELYLQNKCTCK
jgi:hypothetical protein